MKKTKGFGLVGIIVIMVITAIISGITTGVIMLNNREANISGISSDKELQEFIEVYDTLLSKYYNDIDKEGMLNAAEEGMLNFLGDKYTTYLEDTEYQEIIDDLSATYNGIGVEITNNLVVNVTNDSPAEKAGILSGDLIMKVNGTDVSNWDSSSISSLIKKDTSDKVALDINRDGNTLSFNLEKKDLVNKSINYQIIDGTTIGYLLVQKFSENLSNQVKTALDEMEKNGMTSLIIDVRENVGGYLTAAEETASLFLEDGKKIYSLETSNSNYTYKDKTKDKKSYPIVVLINNNTASASEILAAALKESYGATLVGVKSYGKGKVQQVVPLENGDSVKYTSAKWLTPNGVCIDGIGITPDYIITNSETEDLQLSKAIELLQQ